MDDVCTRFSLVTKHDVQGEADSDSDICEGLGLKPADSWRCFSLESAPGVHSTSTDASRGQWRAWMIPFAAQTWGFIFICNPFRYGCQRYWLRRLLRDLPNPANKTNIRGLPLDGKLIWDHYVNSAPDPRACIYRRLRWVTLGYHHKWDTKIYDPEDMSPFPEDIGLLSAFIASRFGFVDFRAEAAIVNYYNMDSTLGGHNDHSELDHTAPLISMSFGQSAIFLVGGVTKTVAPTPVRLRSGDVVILSSTSRLAFHGVPRIFHDSEEYLQQCWGKEPVRPDAEMNSSQSSPGTQSLSEQAPGKEDNSTYSSDSVPAVAEEHYSQGNHVHISRQCTSGSCAESRKHQSSEIDGSDGDPICTMENGDNLQPNMLIKKSRTDSKTPGGVASFRSSFPNAARIMRQIAEREEELGTSDTWDPFEKHLRNARLNVSVRQVNVQRSHTKETGE